MSVPIEPAVAVRTSPAMPTVTPPGVAVIGPVGRVSGLQRYLPPGWKLRPATSLSDLRPDEIVLLSGATEATVTAARALLPRRCRIVALVDSFSPAELIAAVLTAGADVCVRGTHPAILASHLVACRRRQIADSWSHLTTGPAEVRRAGSGEPSRLAGPDGRVS